MQKLDYQKLVDEVQQSKIKCMRNLSAQKNSESDFASIKSDLLKLVYRFTKENSYLISQTLIGEEGRWRENHPGCASLLEEVRSLERELNETIIGNQMTTFKPSKHQHIPTIDTIPSGTCQRRHDRLDHIRRRFQDEERPRPALQAERQAVQATLPSIERWIPGVKLSRQVRPSAGHIDYHQDNQRVHLRRIHFTRLGQHERLASRSEGVLIQLSQFPLS